VAWLLLVVAAVSASASPTNTTENGETLKALLDAPPTSRQSSQFLDVMRSRCMSNTQVGFFDPYRSREDWCNCLAQDMSSRVTSGADALTMPLSRTSFLKCCASFKDYNKDTIDRGDYTQCCGSFIGTTYNSEVCAYASLGTIASNRLFACTGFSTRNFNGPRFCSDPAFLEYEQNVEYEGPPAVVCDYNRDGVNPTVCRAQAAGDGVWSVCGSAKLSYVSAGRPWVQTIDMQTSCCSSAFGTRSRCCEESYNVWGFGEEFENADLYQVEQRPKFFERICETDASGNKFFRPAPLITDISDVCLFSITHDLGLSGDEFASFCDCIAKEANAASVSRADIFVRSENAGQTSGDITTRARYLLNLNLSWVQTCCTPGPDDLSGRGPCCPLQSTALFNPNRQTWSFCN